MSSSDSSDYEEMDTEVVDDILCVFCSDIVTNDRTLISHCQEKHGVQLGTVFAQVGDVFDIIKAINYLRREKPSPDEFILLTKAEVPPWNDETYLEPVIPNDPLLTVDFENLQDRSNRQGSINDVQYLREQLDLAHERIVQMQKTARVILDGKRPQPDERISRAVGDLKVSEDSGYIDSYSNLEIHETMLQDKHRTESYRDAIARNRALLENKVCLDVGCGTGILSMFLARDGKAGKVIGVDFSEMIYSAMDIVRENKLENVVQLVKGRLEDLNLEPVDVIVSEWMGYFLIFESMLDTVIAARDKYLKPGGVLLPNKANIYLTLTDDKELYEKHVAYWDDVYGFKMSCLRKPAIADGVVRVIARDTICGSVAMIKSFDLNTVTVEETMSFSSQFELMSERETSISGIVGFFDTTFDLPNKILLTTDPREEPTHWKQTTFLLPEPIKMTTTDKLCGTIYVRRSPRDRRGLEVEIELTDYRRLKYHV